jgi:predicted anti-sigma-YlaC factor YlaD
MSCKRVKRLLSSRQDSELSSALTGEVDAHLRICRTCSAEYDACERLRLELERWTEIDPAGDFPVRIMERLRPKREKRARFVPSFAYSVAFLVVFLIGFLLSIPEKPQPVPERKIIDLSSMLAGTRRLGLSSIQDQTIRLILGGLHENK